MGEAGGGEDGGSRGGGGSGEVGEEKMRGMGDGGWGRLALVSIDENHCRLNEE